MIENANISLRLPKTIQQVTVGDVTTYANGPHY